MHLGIGALQDRLQLLPTAWRPQVSSATGRLQLPSLLGDGADVLGAYANDGLSAGLYEASDKVEDYMERLQPMRIGHIKMLKEVPKSS